MDKDQLSALGERLLDSAKSAGADHADISLGQSYSRDITVRSGKLENSEHNDNISANLRVLVDQQQAWISLTPRETIDSKELAERVVTMAKAAPKSPYVGLADQTFKEDPKADLDLFDLSTPSVQDLFTRAQAIEEAALGVRGVKQTEGAFASHADTQSLLLTSDGFSGYTRRSRFSQGVSAVAGSGGDRVIDGAYGSCTYAVDLEQTSLTGKRAGERAVRGLKAKKPPSGPVIALFEPRMTARLVSGLISAMKGAAIARHSSFLLGRIDEAIASENFSVIDRPHLPRGTASRLYDGEGVATSEMALIDRGRLSTWLLNSESARELGLRSTGHAVRGSLIGTQASNIEVLPGEETLEEMIGSIDNGVLVTQLLGHGMDVLTGTFSLGATGLIIKKGKLTHAFHEATLAGDFLAMMKTFSPAKDCEDVGSSFVPALRVEGMVLAGT